MDFDFNNLPKIEMPVIKNPLADFMEEQDRAMQASISIANQAAEEHRRTANETRQAAIETAENTAEMKVDLKTVIHNQNSYIKKLEGQNEMLKNLFASGEDGVAVQKEIMQILQQQGNENIFLDKGLDVGVQALFMAIQLYLKSKGIQF